MLDSLWYRRSRWRYALWPATLLFRLLSASRAALYRYGVRRSVELPVPVVVVGNISVGGTGKTPLVIWLVERLRATGLDVGVVTRGYGGTARDWPRWVRRGSDPRLVGDEPVLIAARTACAVVAGPDRVAAARALLAERPVDVLVSDDGLQHYRLRRAFEIAVVDAARGLGNGWCLPAGPLREPPSRLRSVDAVVVNGETIPPDLSVPGEKLFGAHLEPTRVYRLIDGAPARLAAFADRDVVGVAGIGNPQRFFDLLARAGARVAPRPLPDHASLRAADLRHPAGTPVLITEKDAVKCADLDDPEIWVVGVDLVFEPATAERLVERVLRAIDATSTPNP